MQTLREAQRCRDPTPQCPRDKLFHSSSSDGRPRSRARSARFGRSGRSRPASPRRRPRIAERRSLPATTLQQTMQTQSNKSNFIRAALLIAPPFHSRSNPPLTRWHYTSSFPPDARIRFLPWFLALLYRRAVFDECPFSNPAPFGDPSHRCNLFAAALGSR